MRNGKVKLIKLNNVLRHFVGLCKGAFTLANFARDFALSLHVLLNKNYLFSSLNVQASAKSRQCKRTLKVRLHLQFLHAISH